MFFGLFGKKKEEVSDMPMSSVDMGETPATSSEEPVVVDDMGTVEVSDEEDINTSL